MKNCQAELVEAGLLCKRANIFFTDRLRQAQADILQTETSIF